MKAIERERWAKVRQKGMPAYIVVNGVLLWGAPMFLVMTFVLGHSRLPIWQSALLWASAGVAFGIATWMVQEHRYRKANPGRQG